MLYASVDVGSNTLRLLVGGVSRGRIKPVRYERVITRLAGGLSATGSLDRKSMERSIRAIMDFDTVIRQHCVDHTRVVGTSALREAENSKVFIGLVMEETGIAIDVLSGEEEARLTALGVLSSMNNPPSALIVDIGGGSTELIITRGSETLDCITLPVGVVKMVEEHLHSDPPGKADLEALDSRASEVSAALYERAGGLLGGDTVLIGTAGTASTLACIDLALRRFDPRRIHKHTVSLGRLQRMFTELTSVSMQERAGIKGLEPQRADLIIPGIILTIRLMKTMGFGEMKVSDQGLLEGVVLQMQREVGT